MKVSHSNNSSAIIASYFVQYIPSLKICPTILRTDCGTENGHVAATQMLLRKQHDDPQAASSQLYGTSIANQSWWSKFRRGRMEFLIKLFKDSVDEGLLDLHSTVDVACSRYAFMELYSARSRCYNYIYRSTGIRIS